MKRYYIEAYCRVCDCEIATKKRPSEYGDYYLVTDVERTMIPRPNAEEARKAVDELIEAVREQARAWLVEHPDSECHAKNSARVAAARAALTGEE